MGENADKGVNKKMLVQLEDGPKSVVEMLEELASRDMSLAKTQKRRF